MVSKRSLLIIICGLFFVVVSGCTSNNDDTGQSDGDAIDSSLSTAENVVSSGVGSDDVGDVDTPKLSEFEIEACNAADEAGTCDTKLRELAIVSKADCCAVLSKCCD